MQRLGEGVARQQCGVACLRLGPVEEGLGHGFGVRQAVALLGLAGEAVLADVLLDGVEGADARQRLGHRLGLDVLSTLEATAGVRPALGMGEPGALDVARIGAVAVADEHGAVWQGFAEPLAHMDCRTRGPVEEDDLAPAAIPHRARPRWARSKRC